MQRLKERQQVLVMVGERMAVCRLAGFDDGVAVLTLTERQRGGPMPPFSDDAQMTFEYGPSLVMLNGTLQRGSSDDQLRFSVSDGVQVPPRRRDSRRRVRLPVTVRLPSGEELSSWSTDVSARGLGVQGKDIAAPGEHIDVRISLPDGTVVAATAVVVRTMGEATALLIETFQEGSRDLLSRFVLGAATGVAAHKSPEGSEDPGG